MEPNRVSPNEQNYTFGLYIFIREVHRNYVASKIHSLRWKKKATELFAQTESLNSL